MLGCIEACSALDASSAVAGDAGAPPLADHCPDPPFPCERLCWELDARGGAPGGASDVELAALGAPAIRCALARAEECRAGPLRVAQPPEPAEEPLSWTGLFLECAGLPADLDVLQ